MPELALNSTPDIIFHAEGPQEPEANTQFIRALATPFSRTKMIPQEDGSFLIKGVKLLAQGQWTDSSIQTPLFYPAKTLQEFASNWQDLAVWDRHTGGQPRSITSKIGEIENPHFENDAVMGDIRLHGATQTSRDAIELVKRKLISFVSVEHGGTEQYNPSTRQNESSTITFTGIALVNKGACKLCRINEIAPISKTATIAPVMEPTIKSGPVIVQVKELSIEEPKMEEHENEANMAVLIRELTETLKSNHSKEMEQANQAIKELSEKIVKLENTPTPGPIVTPNRDLGTIEFVAIVDSKNGTIRSV